MSFKYQAQKVGEAHYVLDKIGAMNCEVHAFLSEDLYASSEEEAWKQIVNGASFPGAIGAYLMPDCHTGFGLPIGSVVVTEDTIIQGGSGYDISCGIVMARVDLNVGAVKSKYDRSRWVS